jgi:hypothetical protein
VLSNRFKHLHRGHYTHDRLLPWILAREFKNSLVLGPHCIGLYGAVVHTVDGISLVVPSAEHPPAWEQIPLQLISRVKGV